MSPKLKCLLKNIATIYFLDFLVKTLKKIGRYLNLIFYHKPPSKFKIEAFFLLYMMHMHIGRYS